MGPPSWDDQRAIRFLMLDLSFLLASFLPELFRSPHRTDKAFSIINYQLDIVGEHGGGIDVRRHLRGKRRSRGREMKWEESGLYNIFVV